MRATVEGAVVILAATFHPKERNINPTVQALSGTAANVREP